MGEAAQKATATTVKAAVAVEARPEGNFQSSAAKAVATAVPPVEEETEVRSAEVLSTVPSSEPIKVVEDRAVKIRPLESIASFKYGSKLYSIKKGVECIVPQSVALHLRARGLCG